MSASRLAQNVRNKMLVEFDSAQLKSHKSDSAPVAVDAMLCGFILEGDLNDFDTSIDSTDGDWYYKL